jgi:LuxR family maltose regulon positive regulatory protein
MPDVLLSTKLHVPRPQRELVHRPRLIDRLDAGSRDKLTLVSAPAGYGKTTLVSDWVARSHVPVAWLSLDASDNDPVRFATYLIAALQRIDERVGVDIQAALAGSQTPPGEALLTRLVSEIEATAGDPARGFVLVLDDYHLITAQPVHDILNFTIAHLPTAMHLLIAGRTDPPLPISRLRVHGELTEIRTAELRFSTEEVAAFLNNLMGLGLSPADVTALEARTEGWIASLQLAALSMQARQDRHAFVSAFSGSHRYVIDYLVDEVMSRQPESIQAFLRRTSILDRFCAPLCDAVYLAPGEIPSGSFETAVIETETSHEVLRQLEDDNLFLIPLDDERRWYRYHHLFANFLGQRLREKEPQRIPELHRRASQWFEDERSIDDAIRHALAAGDLERATCLVDQIAASLIVRRNPNALLKWVDRLPPDLCQGYPMLCVWHAWALLFVGQLDAVEPVLRVAEAHRDRVPHLPILGYAIAIRAYVANQVGDLAKAIDLSQQALEQMADAPPGKDTLIHRGAAAIWLGVNYRHVGDLGKARQLFIEAISLNQKAGSIYGVLSSEAQLADMAMVQGHLHQAAEYYGRGLQKAQEWSGQEGKGGRAVLASSALYLGLGTVLYQWNDLTGAAPHLQRAVELGELGGAWERMYGYRMLAYLKQAQGEYEAAYDLLRRACAIQDTLSVRQSNIATEPGLEQLRILLARSRPEMTHLLTDVARRIDSQGLRASDEIEFGSPTGYRHESDYSNLARALVALGRAGETMPLLERLLEAAQSMGRQGDAIRYLGLQALAFHSLGDISSALASLGQALTLAEPEGYVRLFVDEGEPMAQLLREAALRGIAPDYVAELRTAFGEPTKDRRRRTETTPWSLVSRPSAPMAEPLSDRELEVLRLMAAGLKYKEVAERLVISLNTVRHHTRNIYSRLNVNSRAQAISKAKELNLL